MEEKFQKEIHEIRQQAETAILQKEEALREKKHLEIQYLKKTNLLEKEIELFDNFNNRNVYIPKEIEQNNFNVPDMEQINQGFAPQGISKNNHFKREAIKRNKALRSESEFVNNFEDDIRSSRQFYSNFKNNFPKENIFKKNTRHILKSNPRYKHYSKESHPEDSHPISYSHKKNYKKQILNKLNDKDSLHNFIHNNDKISQTLSELPIENNIYTQNNNPGNILINRESSNYKNSKKNRFVSSSYSQGYVQGPMRFQKEGKKIFGQDIEKGNEMGLRDQLENNREDFMGREMTITKREFEDESLKELLEKYAGRF